MPTIVKTASGTIQCDDEGSGIAILVLHGGMGGRDQSRIFAEALGTTPDRFRVIAVTRPGYPGTPLTSGRSPEAQADLYAALLDELGVDRTFVAAVSGGGPSAIAFALRHAARCRGLILVSCCTGHMDVPERFRRRLPVMRFAAKFSWLTAFLRWLAARRPESAARRSIPDEGLRKRTIAHPVAGRLMHAMWVGLYDRLAERLEGTVNDTEQFEALTAMPHEELAVPVLVVHGTADKIVPFSHGENLASSAPHAELMAIDGGGHTVLFTHLDAIRARVADFITRQS